MHFLRLLILHCPIPKRHKLFDNLPWMTHSDIKGGIRSVIFERGTPAILYIGKPNTCMIHKSMQWVGIFSIAIKTQIYGWNLDSHSTHFGLGYTVCFFKTVPSSKVVSVRLQSKSHQKSSHQSVRISKDLAFQGGKVKEITLYMRQKTSKEQKTLIESY